MDVVIDEIDKRVIRAMQGEFPITKEPYKELAKTAGIDEDEFLTRVKRLKETGAIRKMGAVLKHREVGFTANVLCAWEIPAENLDATAKNMSLNKSVTHCYDRNTAPGWNYNLYTMIHGQSKEECENIVKKLKIENNVKKEPVLLYSKKEWKKASMKYFAE